MTSNTDGPCSRKLEVPGEPFALRSRLEGDLRPISPSRRDRSHRPTCTGPEMFKSSYYADMSLDQWMALTPRELVEAHLKLEPEVMDALRKGKMPIVPA